VRCFFGNGGQRCWIIRVADPVDSDGSAGFSASLFLDHDVKDESSGQLMAQADFIRYQSSEPRKLKGIYAALAIEEATIIAVPDAIHLGRKFLRHPHSTAPEEPMVPVILPSEGFSDCRPGEIDAPLLYVTPPTDAACGTYTVSWSTVPGAEYVLEEATQPDWSGVVVVYAGGETAFGLCGHPQGDYYYRVSASVAGKRSRWSPEKVVQVLPSKQWQQNSRKKYSSRSLLMIHRALITMCAARGDLSAVLTLPAHFREGAALRHVSKLKSLDNPGQSDLSFASLYHPWQIGRDNRSRNEFRAVPPDGAICGIMAQRALSRGAWVAPANEIFRDVVALTPSIPHVAQELLQEAQINVIRQEPHGFITASADTLSNVRDLRPLNVRRLLILIRKLALRKGAEYVFEPNDASFRRMVQRGFESLLEEMFMRGAFSGVTPAMAYQVFTGDSVNSRQSADLGCFIVELRVAPSRPLSFLILRLMQIGDRMTIAEGF
jgi:hypothetical protein